MSVGSVMEIAMDCEGPRGNTKIMDDLLAADDVESF